MTQVVMPQMGESLSEGTVAKWLKKVGEPIELDEPLLEISTDKVDTEIPAPADGILLAILVPEGETVPVGTPLATIRQKESTEPESEQRPEAESSESSSTGTDSETKDQSAGHFRSSHEPILYERGEAGTQAQTDGRSSHEGSAASTATFSPAVRRLIQDEAIEREELDKIAGTGKTGRITKKDVQAYLKARSSNRLTTRQTALVPPAGLGYTPEPEDRLVPLGELRTQIAKNLLWSQQMTAQVTSFTEINVHRLVQHVDSTREEFERTEGFPLTFTPFVADVCVRCLKEYPIFNASLVADQIAYRKHVHLGIALALEQGLLAPVIKNADEMSFLGLGRALHDAKARAMRDELSHEEAQGASFTLTTPGLFGGTMGTPMVTPPQLAILALGTVTKKPVVVDDAIAIRPVMMAALSFDHRIIDGMSAYQFIERIRHLIENYDFS